MAHSAEDVVLAYYSALRAGEPLHPFFADDGPVVKVGVWSRHVGADLVASALREQTGTTGDWVVESRDLRVGTAEAGDGAAGDGVAWFGDEVSMGWTDRGTGRRHEFDTRWSGALVRRDDVWRFVEMHVSVPQGGG